MRDIRFINSKKRYHEIYSSSFSHPSILGNGAKRLLDRDPDIDYRLDSRRRAVELWIRFDK